MPNRQGPRLLTEYEKPDKTELPLLFEGETETAQRAIVTILLYHITLETTSWALGYAQHQNVPL